MSASDGGRGIRIQVELPEWLSSLRRPLEQLRALYERFGSLPGAIFGLISLYLLNGILDVIGVITGSVLFAFDLVVGAFRWVQRALVGAFGAVGIDVLGALTDLQVALAGIVAGAGPAGPFIAVAAVSVSLYLMYRVGVALLGELPVGSSIVDILGLR